MKQREHRGFTLVEVMIVVAVVAILASLALPSFQRQMRQSRHTEAHATLTRTAHLLERCFSRFGAYNNAGCQVGALLGGGGVIPSALPAANAWYQITGAINANTFTLTAAPLGAQTADAACQTLTLNQAGQKGQTPGTLDDYW